MTPKQKAQELVDKMYFSRRYDDIENYIPAKAWEHSKMCALIAVDEIINVIEENCLEYDDNYWQEVKKEIEKL
jgi:hypothetical protein